jgi:hypothetical protein
MKRRIWLIRAAGIAVFLLFLGAGWWWTGRDLDGRWRGTLGESQISLTLHERQSGELEGFAWIISGDEYPSYGLSARVAGIRTGSSVALRVSLDGERGEAWLFQGSKTRRNNILGNINLRQRVRLLTLVRE